MSDLDDLISELEIDPLFAAEYGKLRLRRDITGSLVSARRKAGLTQAELSQKAGISLHRNLSLESGRGSPDMRDLRRAAEALNLRLRIALIPGKAA